MTGVHKLFVTTRESRQDIGADELIDGGLVEPFFSFDRALDLYYQNTWHRRCIRIKAHLLSQIEETTLARFLPPGMNPKMFLSSVALQLEIFGNAFLEKAGDSAGFWTYILPAHEGRIDKDMRLHQYRNGIPCPLAGWHLKLESPASRFYGEPDYLAAIRKLATENLIDTYNETFFSNSAVPNLAILFEGTDPSDEQIQAVKQFLAANYKGVTNSHRTLVLSTGAPTGERDPKIRFEKLNAVPDVAFESFKRLNREEIIAAHGVPPRLVGIVTAGQLGGGGELIGQLHQFNELEIKPKIEILEWFFRSIGVQVNLKPIDVTDFKDDADVVSGLVQLGIVSIQEARDILGWQKGAVNGGAPQAGS